MYDSISRLFTNLQLFQPFTKAICYPICLLPLYVQHRKLTYFMFVYFFLLLLNWMGIVGSSLLRENVRSGDYHNGRFGGRSLVFIYDYNKRVFDIICYV